MHETMFRVSMIFMDSGQWLAIVCLGSLVLRQEKRHRDDERAIRRTHAAIMREVHSNGSV